MMHTEMYCDHLARLDPTDAIRAIHQAWLQLNATSRTAADEAFDNEPSIAALASCLRQAGHVGFQQ